MKTSPLVMDAIDTLCVRFEMGDYNPTPIIDLGVLVAYADGAVDAAEVEALGSIIGALLGARMDSELVGFMAQASIDVANQAGTASRARVVAEILMDCDAVEEGLIVALAVAFASEGLKTSERALIASIASAAEYDAGKLDALIERVRSATAA